MFLRKRWPAVFAEVKRWHLTEELQGTCTSLSDFVQGQVLIIYFGNMRKKIVTMSQLTFYPIWHWLVSSKNL